jgi:hypothetical protein
MILIKILDHDLHRSKKGLDSIPLWLETPAKESFLPAIVSSSRGSFISSNKLTKDDKIRSGIFEHDPDRIDDVLEGLFTAATKLSLDQGWKNVFRGSRSASSAFGYIQNQSGVHSQPHACLVPESWDPAVLSDFMGPDLDGSFFKKTCRIYTCRVPHPVMLSRPDFVGLYTQFVGSRSTIVLHNVRRGIAFCLPKD